MVLDDLQECDSSKVRQLNQGYLAEIHDRLIEPTTFDFAELVADPPFWADASFRTRRNVRRRHRHCSSRFLGCYRADQQQPQGPQTWVRVHGDNYWRSTNLLTVLTQPTSVQRVHRSSSQDHLLFVLVGRHHRVKSTSIQNRQQSQQATQERLAKAYRTLFDICYGINGTPIFQYLSTSDAEHFRFVYNFFFLFLFSFIYYYNIIYTYFLPSSNNEHITSKAACGRPSVARHSVEVPSEVSVVSKPLAIKGRQRQMLRPRLATEEQLACNSGIVYCYPRTTVYLVIGSRSYYHHWTKVVVVF